MKDSFLEHIIERLDKLDSASVQGYLRRLSREKGFMEAISNTIREGIIVIEKGRQIYYANPAARQLIGLPENLTNQKVDRFIREIDWETLLGEDPGQWHRVSRQELEVFYPIHRYLNFYLVPHENPDALAGDDSYAVIILSDITEDRQKREETIESQKSQMVSMLAAGVAHEIGNPLNSINIHLQLLERMLKREVTDEMREEALDAVKITREELDRLDNIINHFLKAVRPAQLDLEPVQINRLLEDSLRFMRQELENRDILTEASWPATIPIIAGDANQLRQAFYNIIKNALQAMPDGGLLRIDCTIKDKWLNISFADTGVGITSEEISRIFDPYFTTKKEGNGLGLLVVERICRDHGGDLSIESEANKGTIFRIRLPLGAANMPRLSLPSETEEIDYDG